MRTVAMVKCLVVSSIAAASIGCAPSYHCYTDCYVNCRYCPPPPLPYGLYDECACHSCAAEPYLSAPPPPPDTSADTGRDIAPAYH